MGKCDDGQREVEGEVGELEIQGWGLDHMGEEEECSRYGGLSG